MGLQKKIIRGKSFGTPAMTSLALKLGLCLFYCPKIAKKQHFSTFYRSENQNKT
jgi:hypothetical protein